MQEPSAGRVRSRLAKIPSRNPGTWAIRERMCSWAEVPAIDDGRAGDSAPRGGDWQHDAIGPADSSAVAVGRDARSR